jgi:hypothetical protein
MKNDDYYDQLGEVVELRPEEHLIGIREICLVKDPEGFHKVRIAIGDYMYFDSPNVLNLQMAIDIIRNLKARLH